MHVQEKHTTDLSEWAETLSVDIHKEMMAMIAIAVSWKTQDPELLQY